MSTSSVGFPAESLEDAPGRRGTNSYKWDLRPRTKDGRDVLPMWVADMDLPVASFIQEAIRERTLHPFYGYSFADEGYRQAFVDWQERRHRWMIDRQTLLFAPGVMPAIRAAVLELTDPGDEVIIQPPVYYPFFGAVSDNGRTVKENNLVFENGRYVMNLDELERMIGPRTKMLMLCSPHNPVGRVWSQQELSRLSAIVLEHNLIVISDEIHADIRRAGTPFVPFASLGPEVAARTIACHAPSKTFNIPGIASAHLIIADPTLRRRMNHALERLGLTLPNILSLEASQAAYRYGDQWVDGLCRYLDSQVAWFHEQLASRFGSPTGDGPPLLRASWIEGTYLAWIDFRPLMERTGTDDAQVQDALFEHAALWLNSGSTFGSPGRGFHRMNLACPPSYLAKGFARLEQAVAFLQEQRSG